MKPGYATIMFHSADLVKIDPTIASSVAMHTTDSGVEFTVPAGQTINETLKILSITLTQPAVALVNGRTQDWNYTLQPNDSIVILFQISGG